MSKADVKIDLIRRITVFPIKAREVDSRVSENAWWKMREVLTEDKRLLIATKRFMVNREVFQPRESLKPADVLLLSRVLEAQALLVTYINDHQLNMIAYESENGVTLWQQSIGLNFSLPISEQLEEACVKLVKDFTASIPYQGFQVIDPLIGDSLYEDEENRTLAQVEVGKIVSIEKGDPVQWIEVKGNLSGPVFQTNGQIEVVAEGKVLEVRGSRVVVEVTRHLDTFRFPELALVRFPNELKRLQDSSMLAERHGLPQNLTGQELVQLKSHHEPSTELTSIAFVVHLAAFIWLAF